MKQSIYLYGVEAKEWKRLKYEEAVKVKISYATALLNELSGIHFKVRDEARILDVINAIRHNKALLEELK